VTVTSANGVRSPVMLKGQTAFMKFDAAGVYDYICGLHPNMKGKVIVQ
jgi:plastocyanin